MLLTVINSLRAFKGLHDLAFSEDQFYVEQRAKFLGGVQHCVEQARKGRHNQRLQEPTSGSHRSWNPDVCLTRGCDFWRPVMSREYVSVWGGVVDDLIVAPQIDGTWTVVDWDNIEADPACEWGQFDEQDKKCIKENYPDRLRQAFFPIHI